MDSACAGSDPTLCSYVEGVVMCGLDNTAHWAVEARAEERSWADHPGIAIEAAATAVYHQRCELEASSAMGVIHLSRLVMRDTRARCPVRGSVEDTRTRTWRGRDNAEKSQVKGMMPAGAQCCDCCCRRRW